MDNPITRAGPLNDTIEPTGGYPERCAQTATWVRVIDGHRKGDSVSRVNQTLAESRL